jgi:hypothetical protein
MALDDRQQGIREGAGLEESRLNTEFIDWLRRWGTTLLMVFAILALGYALYERYQRSLDDTRDQAFIALEASASSGALPSPEAMRALAAEYPGVTGVRLVALTKAADAYLGVARLGVRPGATYDKDGIYQESDLLSEVERADQLTQAEGLYNQVLDASAKDRGLVLHAIAAAYGLAAVAETRGTSDQAKALYERAATLAEDAGYQDAGVLARKWAGDQASIASPPTLIAKSQLAKLPWADEKPAEDLPAAKPVEPSGPELPAPDAPAPSGDPDAPAPTPAPPGDAPSGEAPGSLPTPTQPPPK